MMNEVVSSKTKKNANLLSTSTNIFVTSTQKKIKNAQLNLFLQQPITRVIISNAKIFSVIDNTILDMWLRLFPANNNHW